VRIPTDALDDHVSAFRTALGLFGAAELADFLPPPDHPRYLEILCELIRVELAHGWRTGQPTSVESYRDRYPELFADPVLAYRVAQDDFQARQEAGDLPPALSPLDPAVSSKFDIALSPDDSSFPVTTPSGPDEPIPFAEVGQTRRASEDKRPLTDPELVWKLNETMLELPKVGDDFLGFSLLAELGKGAFGKVFLAQQGQLAGRLVALKVATGLFNESQALAQLQHTHIVPIYSYHHGQPFQAVCMPYLGSTTLAHVLADIRTQKSMPSSGKEILSTLNDRKKSTRRFEDSSRPRSSVRRHDRLPADTAVPLTAPVKTPASVLELEGMSYVDSILWLAVRLADGLAHAHAHGIIHRDLKPANVLLTDDGLPMLLDFNLAQDNKLRGRAGSASIGGTLPYMAPEHLEAFRGNDRPVDARSDLYSLGVILYELLTSAAPFPSYRKLSTRDTVDRMIRDRLEGPRGLRRLNANISPAVEAIVLRCLQGDPTNRYQTVRQLQEDLQCQLDDLPLKHAGNPSLRERCAKFRRRHPRLTSVTTVVLLACLALTGLVSGFAVREEQHRRLEARQTLARFEADAQTTYFLLNARTAKDQLDEGERTCRATLGYFQILENPDWRHGPDVQRLPIVERQRLEGEAGQLLVLLAHAQRLAGERETDPERQETFYEKGLQFCSRAGDCFGDDPPMALWKQQGELHQRLGHADEARRCLENARKAALQTAQDRYLAARMLAEEGKFQSALPLVREAIRMKPQDFNLHFLQGICHDYLNQHAEATAAYSICIALRPNFYGAYYNRGLSHLRQRDPKAALADFDEVARLRPEFGDVYVQRALAYQGVEKNAEAIADLTEALERNVPQTRIYLLRAKLREKTGEAAGAKQDLAEGLRREPTDEVSWITRGIAFLPGDPNRAIADFDEALKLNPRSLAALHNKAHVLGKYLKRTEDAVKTLDKAVQLYPDDARPLAGRGTYLARLGKRADALKYAELVLNIDPSPANLYQVAGIYALTSAKEPDDQREATRLLTSALKKGFGFEHLEIDHDLDPIRQSPAFRRVIEASRGLQSPK
jgi:serine/threonine protein kinase/Flp pilus assembly protein TadD